MSRRRRRRGEREGRRREGRRREGKREGKPLQKRSRPRYVQPDKQPRMNHVRTTKKNVQPR